MEHLLRRMYPVAYEGGGGKDKSPPPLWAAEKKINEENMQFLIKNIKFLCKAIKSDDKIGFRGCLIRKYHKKFLAFGEPPPFKGLSYTTECIQIVRDRRGSKLLAETRNGCRH